MFQVVTRDQAMEQGVRRYFTGKPCGRGHLCERLVSTYQCLECLKPQIKRWQNDNQEAIRVLRVKYRDKRLTNKRRWSRENRRHLADYAARRRRENPQVLLADRLRTRLWKALHGQSKSRSTIELLGVPIVEAVAIIERQFLPGMTWANHGEWHLDHRRALSTFDLTDPAQVAVACHISNLQPLWKLDNLRKGSSSTELLAAA